MAPCYLLLLEILCWFSLHWEQIPQPGTYENISPLEGYGRSPPLETTIKDSLNLIGLLSL